jgi:hypothetical protein
MFPGSRSLRICSRRDAVEVLRQPKRRLGPERFPDHRQFRTMNCQYVRSEAGLRAGSGRPPVQEDVIC